jgi:hypothetical protein
MLATNPHTAAMPEGMDFLRPFPALLPSHLTIYSSKMTIRRELQNLYGQL